MTDSKFVHKAWGAALALLIGMSIAACQDDEDGGNDDCGSSGDSANGGGSGGSGATGAGGGGDSGGSASGGSASGGSANECTQGATCNCGELVSTTICESGVETCDCAACPEPPPAETPDDFEACGGEPYGTWSAVQVDPASIRAGFWDEEQGAIWCPMAMAELEQPQMMVRLTEAGGGSYWDTGLGGRGFISESCTLQRLGRNCADLAALDRSLYGPHCVAGPCGSCECQIEPYAQGAGVLSWSRNGSLLSIESNTFYGTFSYCVVGNTLRLEDVSSGLLYELQRGYAQSAPTDCSSRELEDCHWRGCHPQPCQGPSEECALAGDADSCAAIEGCSWDSTACGGTVRDCLPYEFGLEPSCNFITNPVCTGKPEHCFNQLSREACAALPRCQWDEATGCRGYPGNCQSVPIEECVAIGCEVVPG